MTKKQMLRVAILLLMMLGLLLILSTVFKYENSQMSARYTTYVNLPEDTVDVLLVGTSGIDRYWIAAKGYEEHGITAYPLSFDEMPAWLMVDVIREALIKQNPKLIVVDMRGFTVLYNNDISKYGTPIETPIHRVIDIMPATSINRLRAATKSALIVSRRDGWDNSSALSFYFPFIKYHGRWSTDDFTIDSMQLNPSEYLGMFMREGSSAAEIPIPPTKRTDAFADLDPICEEALYELLSYTDTLDCEVLFLLTPKYMSEGEYARMNTLCRILDQHGYAYKCYDSDDGTYNLYTDFFHTAHVNYKGAERFTRIFSEYLKDNYVLPDRREDESCAADWEGVYEKILDTYNGWMKKRRAESLNADLRYENSQAVISWERLSPFDGYVVYRSDEASQRYEEIQVIEDGDISSFVDHSAEEGKTYSYMVRPFKRTGESFEYGNYFEAKRLDP